MKKKIKTLVIFLLSLLLFIIATGCARSFKQEEKAAGIEYEITEIAPELVPLFGSPPVFNMLTPTADGVDVERNAKAEVDCSNLKDGYIMIRYLEKSNKTLRVIISGPSGTAYTYYLNQNGEYDVFPLSDGSGSYRISVYQNIENDKYATVISIVKQVALKDEFAPFLRPNQYVNYNKDSKVLKKASELIKNKEDLLEKISLVYQYVINNITYDKELAATVQSGYLPDLDKVLKNKKGICFDYAALMTAMLRSQSIPTKLVVGYSGDYYHAWINVYSEETGWIDNIIYFDGVNWNLMDPTFASSKNLPKDDITKYIGDAKNYTAKYLY